MWHDADNLSAGLQRGIGERAHQSNAATAKHHRHLSSGQQATD